MSSQVLQFHQLLLRGRHKQRLHRVAVGIHLATCIQDPLVQACQRASGIKKHFIDLPFVACGCHHNSKLGRGDEGNCSATETGGSQAKLGKKIAQFFHFEYVYLNGYILLWGMLATSMHDGTFLH